MARNGTGRSGGMKAGPLVWFGLVVAGLGWAMVIAALVVGDAMLSAGSLVATLSLRANLVTIGQTAILSGLGLAIVGTLRNGFGAFSRFFDVVLQRSSVPRASSAPPRAEREPEPAISTPTITASTGFDRAAPPVPPPPLKNRDRNYVILGDGSVEVETMFGTRVFATLDEARDFIR